MDATGARELLKRLEAQENWRQAAAVRDGRQPAVDPEANELEAVGEGIRIYRCAEQWAPTSHAQRPMLRRVKRLVDGWWQTSFEAEREAERP